MQQQFHTYINPNRIEKSIVVRVRSGRNKGKIAGHILYEHNKTPYYYVEKKNRQGQMWLKPEYMGDVAVSSDIISKDLIPKNINKIIFMFIGYDKNSFYVVMNIKDFLQGRIIEYDDKQYVASWRDKPRIYGNQILLI